MNILKTVTSAVVVSPVILVLSFQVSAQMIPPSFIYTGKQAMWDRYVFTSVADSVLDAKRAKESSRASSQSAAMTPAAKAQAAPTPPMWHRHTAEDASFSALCPPDWVVDSEGSQQALRLHPKQLRIEKDAQFYDHFIELWHASNQEVASWDTHDPETIVKEYAAAWFSQKYQNKLQLPRQINVSELASTFGPAWRVGLSHLTGHNYTEEAEFLLIKRPSGYFLIQLVRPIDPDSIPDDVYERIFSTFSFGDRTQGEKVRESQRYYDYAGS